MLRESDVRTLVEEHNRLATDVQAIITAAATSLAAIAAVAPTAALIANNQGVVITPTAG
jgi:hypothetical protein